MKDPFDPPQATGATPARPGLPARLSDVGEHLRLVTVALRGLGDVIGGDEPPVDAQVGVVEARVAELLRGVGRLARSMGVAERWGIDILFGLDAAPPARPPAPHESVELESFELLGPLSPLLGSRPPTGDGPPKRVERLTPAPWWTGGALPDPLDGESADDEGDEDETYDLDDWADEPEEDRSPEM